MTKILKNTTGSAIVLDKFGVEIAASSQRTVHVAEYLDLGTIDSVAELTIHINSGDIVVNNGSVDLDADEAIRWIAYADRAEIQSSDVTVDNVNTILNFEGGLTATDEGAGKVTVTSDVGTGAGSGMVHGKAIICGGSIHYVQFDFLLDSSLNFIKKEEC